MRIRPYIESKDFDEITKWITEERAHALWCANLMVPGDGVSGPL